MTDKVIKTISKHHMIPLGCTVGIGLSGGADSVMLLHCLNTIKDKYNLHLIAVIMGAESSKSRNADASDLLNDGFANYSLKNIVSKKNYNIVFFKL